MRKQNSEVLYMSVKDYAERVSVSVGTIYDMCRHGKLPAVKIGSWRINVRRADEILEQLCEEHMQAYAPAIKPAKASVRTANAGKNYLARLEQIRKSAM
jgi:excisionase family DNA binding protein